jgi:branched-chain amino acid transport system substrate-binding protein
MLRAIAALLVGAFFIWSSGTFAQDIRIGVAGPMTGGEAAFGRQMKNGAEQAVADINASGGVLGKKLSLDIGDDACDPKQARAVAERFVGAKVPVVIGHFCSSSSIPASEAYADGNVLQISPASSNPLFTERKLWNVLRVTGRDDQQGGVAASYIAKNFAGKNVALLNDKTTYGRGLADETKKALNAARVTEKMFEAFNKGDKDFSAIVTRLKRENIDVVFVGGYHQEAGLILRQMRDQGLKTVLIAGDAILDMEFASITGPTADGTLFTFGSDPRNKPAARVTVEKFKAKGIDPEGYTLYAYAAVQVWAKAAAKAATTDPRRVADTIKAGEWDTVLGNLSFDGKGDRRQIDYVVYRWDAKGKYSEIDAGAGRWEIAAATPTPDLSVQFNANKMQPVVQALPLPSTPQVTVPPVQKPVATAAAPSVSLEKRVALVIGNSAYKSVPRLPNPQRDAAAVAAALRQVGFQSVTLQTDLSLDKTLQALREFARAADGADWALVYFAGHGIEVGGVNYLIPIDATLANDRDVPLEAVPLPQVLNVAERAGKLRLVILDACRINPFDSQMKRADATRAVARGLARVEPNKNTIVAYAAKDGETASDGNGANSPFTAALVKNLQTPGLEVRLLFDTVRDDVMDMTNNRQQPFSYGSITARQQFYFLAPK